MVHPSNANAVIERARKMNTFRLTKTHRPGGGLFLGLRLHYRTRVISSRWKLVKKKFVKVPDHFVWHVDIGLLTQTFSIYIRKQLK